MILQIHFRGQATNDCPCERNRSSMSGISGISFNRRLQFNRVGEVTRTHSLLNIKKHASFFGSQEVTWTFKGERVSYFREIQVSVSSLWHSLKVSKGQGAVDWRAMWALPSIPCTAHCLYTSDCTAPGGGGEETRW